MILRRIDEDPSVFKSDSNPSTSWASGDLPGQSVSSPIASTSTNVASSTKTAGINPLTKLPYSQKYFELFRKRIQLPVWEYREKFFDLLDKNQILVLVGETGSGKTTQIPQWCVEHLRDNKNKKAGLFSNISIFVFYSGLCLLIPLN